MKYKLTLESKEVLNVKATKVILFRIEATKEFTLLNGTVVKVGEKGGWIEGQHNLSQEGTCWVDEESMVMDTASVSGDAILIESNLYDQAKVLEKAQVEKSDIKGTSVIRERARVKGSIVSGNSGLFFSTEVYDCEFTNVHVGELLFNIRGYFKNSVIVSGLPTRILNHCHCEDSLIHSGRITISAPANFKNVTVSLSKKFLIFQKTKLINCSMFKRDSTFKTKRHASEETIIEGESKDDVITIDGDEILLANSTLSGHVSVQGDWEIHNSKLMDYSSLMTSPGKHIMDDVVMKDFSYIRDTTFDGTKTVSNLELSGDTIVDLNHLQFWNVTV
ncbi:hypothetical protein [Rossellomorea marisflavi]|uniref:hypothetical protein n=1 Tax=Rossellomorea marisflavi TaxID=189381 RepID=UPI003F9F4CA8